MSQVDSDIVKLWSELCVQLTSVAQLLGTSTPPSIVPKAAPAPGLQFTAT